MKDIQSYNNSQKLAKKSEKTLNFVFSSPLNPTEETPLFFSGAKGAQIFDVDGNSYFDFSSGEGAVTLGHNFQPLQNVLVEHLVDLKITSSYPSKYLIDTAELIMSKCSNLTHINFFPSGTTAVRSGIVAIKEYTKKSIILSAGFHGWDPMWDESTQFLEPNKDGVVNWYFLLNVLEDSIKKYYDDIACICISPDYIYLSKEFYIQLFSIARQKGILIFCDDVMCGFRYSNGPSFLTMGLTADLYTFSKCLANGYKLACLVGPENIIKNTSSHVSTGHLGSLSFIISSFVLNYSINNFVPIQINKNGFLFIEKLKKLFLNLSFPAIVAGDIFSFQFVFPDNNVEEAFYKTCLKLGIYFEPGWNQCPSFSFTINDYEKILILLEEVCIVVLNTIQVQELISIERRLTTAWRLMHGCADLGTEAERINFLYKINSWQLESL